MEACTGPRVGRVAASASVSMRPAYGAARERPVGHVCGPCAPSTSTVAGVDEERARAAQGAEVGVGPWTGPWPADERYDPELLAQGDRRNVVDRYRYWSLDAIVADLDTRRHPFHVAVENWEHDLNIGTVVRCANAF